MANIITFGRVIAAFTVLFILQINTTCNFLAIVLIVILMLLDALDGFIARRFSIASLNGSIYDILADRIIENAFFIYFATLSLLNVWFALAIMIRGLITDSLRAIFIAQGKTAFGKNTLHKTKWTKFISCSKVVRGLYNTLKMLTFVSFAAIAMPGGYFFYLVTMKTMVFISNLFLWSTLLLSLLRASTVLFDSLFEFKKNDANSRIEHMVT